MKINVLIFLFTLCNVYYSYAQLDDRTDNGKALASVTIVVPDTTNSQFFSRNPEVDHLFVTFIEKKPYVVFVNFNSPHSVKLDRHHYDMKFEGDLFALNFKYGKINYPFPDISTNYIESRRLLPTKYNHLIATIKRDSVEYHFWATNDIDGNEFDMGTPPKFAGDLERLSQTVSKSLSNKNSIEAVDSVIVFQGMIENLPMNNIRDLKLIAGRESVFSQAVRSQFERESSVWHPAKIDGPFMSFVKIFARLNEDGSVTLLTTRKQRSHNGE